MDIEGACRKVVEEIRANKFGADNPLAPDMHQAIRHLATELYQKDLHFVMELVQNADDNTYEEGVVPELEFVLVESDVAGVGVEWTLLVLNNEVGFSSANINSLCSIGRSTKSGKRDTGYIGEKGIGFKSVFLVTRHPIVISNGFRIRFNEAPAEGTQLGYIVPEWAEQPSDADLLDCLGICELPNTVIVLPIRPDKVQAMREQLFQLSPQLVLFLHKIEKLSVRQQTSPPKRMSVRRYTMLLPPQFCIPNNCSYSKVRLSFGNKEASYHVWQQEFPVQADHEADHRRDVQSWMITLAFPIHNSEVAVGQPDIYAFLPTKLTAGFPFLINADFLLVSSRESIRFDSKWNRGILSCIPQAFMEAFMFFLKAAGHLCAVPLIQLQCVYRYVPCDSLLVRELGFVREAIIEQMKTQATILCDAKLGQRFLSLSGDTSAALSIGTGPPFFSLPSMARMINPRFGQVLQIAHKENVQAPKLLTSQRVYVVDAELMENHQSVLLALKVQSFTEKDYVECLRSPNWLASLSESLYVKVLYFVSEYLPSKALFVNVPLLKYVGDDGNIKMLAVRDKNEVPVYMSKVLRDEHFLSKWRPVFQRWVSVHFMPRKTVQAINDLSGEECRSLCNWLHQVANVGELSVLSYGELLSHKCERMLSERDLALGVMHFFLHATQDGYKCERMLSERDLALGVMHFFLHATQDGYVKLPGDCQKIILRLPLIDNSGNVFCNKGNPILLPGSVCAWPRVLLQDSWKGHVDCLSEQYLELPPSISDEVGGQHAVIQFLKRAVKAVDIFDIKSPPDASLYTGNPWGHRAEDVRSFLGWMKELAYIPPRLKMSLQETEWVETLDHGKKKPLRCFLDWGQWNDVLHNSDVPFVDINFYGDLRPYVSILRNLGVVVNPGEGANAVAEHVCQLSKAGYSEVQSDMAIRWYTYLRIQNWLAWAARSSEKLIWIPGHAWQSYSLGSWRSAQECVISDRGGLFRERLVVLDHYYKNEDVLKFFKDNMGVALTPGTEKYCQLWVDWGENRREVSQKACKNAWHIIAEGWELCARSWEAQNFKKRCRIPCTSSTLSEDDDMVELARPEEVLYADNLVLAEVFSKAYPAPKFAWHPRGAAAAPWVEHLINCYMDVGVKKLSDALEGGGPVGYSSKIEVSRASGSGGYLGQVGKGVYRAILGYLADPRHGILAQARKRMVMQLEDVEVWQVEEVGEVEYRVVVGTCVYEASRSAHVRWEKGEKRIYMAMPSGCSKVKVAHELATEVANGVLGRERVALVQGLQELLFLAAGFAFDDDAVKELLCLRNLRLNLEDEDLLWDLPILSFCFSRLPC